jgi:hypothetical protein
MLWQEEQAMVQQRRAGERPLRDRLLDNLHRFGPRRQRDLEFLLQKSSATIWVALNQLEKEQKVFHRTDGRWEFIRA